MMPDYTPLDKSALPVTMLTRQSLAQYMLLFRGDNHNPSYTHMTTGPLPSHTTGSGINAIVGGASTNYLSGPGSVYPLAPSAIDALTMSMLPNPRPDLLPLTTETYNAANVLPITSLIHGPPGPYTPIVHGQPVYGSQGPGVALLAAATRNNANRRPDYSIESKLG